MLRDTSGALAVVKARLAALAPRRGPFVDNVRNGVQDVVLVASSSRGGSSMFSETLRHSGELLHFQAEVNPFFLLAGLGPGVGGRTSDALPADAAFDADVLDRELALDMGNRQIGTVDLGAWAAEVAWRLQAQWPTLELDPDVVERCALDAVEANENGHWNSIHRGLLLRVGRVFPAVNPWYSDLSPAVLHDVGPPPVGPPGDVVLEEPPFVAVRPWRRATAADLRRPLIIKTPSNAYRLDFLVRLFPRARVRVLHLVRNPAATINGLVDGWRFRGFHAQRMTAPLDIPGYSDVLPHSADWWKFDLPPDWQSTAGQGLADVAAFQWCSAHRSTLDFLDANPGVDRLRVDFEDVVADPDTRRRTFARVLQWLGAPMDASLQAVIDRPLPPVMATAPPRARRWFARADELAPVLARPDVQDLAERLQLGPPSDWR